MLMMYLSMLDTEEKRRKVSEIYEQNKAVCIKVALKITKNEELAEDAVHDAFMEVLKDKEKIFSLSCSEMRSWIVIIVRNKSIDILRRRKFIHDTPIDEFENILESSEMPIEMQIISLDEFDNLVKHIFKLSENYKIPFEMKYIHNLSNSEIAKELGLTVKNVEIRLYRAKVALRKMIENEVSSHG